MTYGNFWVLRKFEFKPANGIFSQKGKFPTFQKCFFRDVMSKIEVEQNWRYGYVQYYGKLVKIGYTVHTVVQHEGARGIPLVVPLVQN